MNALTQILPQQGTFLHEINNDTMEPTYRRGQHAVVCMPVDRYSGEGVYLVGGELYRCQLLCGRVTMSRGNTFYRGQAVTADQFNSGRLALVVADIAIRNAAWRV